MQKLSAGRANRMNGDNRMEGTSALIGAGATTVHGARSTVACV
jgi:hypothetical protein